MLYSIFIGLIVFLCGWVLMAVEILGGKILPIYFGSGIYVWGSVISVFLLALSLGYLAGGLLSRRLARLWVLLAVVAAAGVWIAGLPFYYDRLATYVQNRLERPLADQMTADPEALAASLKRQAFAQRFGSLLASAALFLPPSVLLGMVSPYAVRLMTRSVGGAGFSSGVLYALSTVGSFLGTLVTAFYLHAHMRTPNILRLSGGALAAAALLGAALYPLLRPISSHEASSCSLPDDTSA